MKNLAILAFDLGATSGRGVLGRFDGQRLSMEEVHRFPNQPVRLGDAFYWDFPRLFLEVKQGITKARQKAGEIDSIGIDTWGVDFGLLDKAGRLLSNPVHYRDERYHGIMQKAFEKVPQEEIFKLTGIQFLPFNTIYQLYALKLANGYELDTAAQFLMMPDLFTHFLCGTNASEFTHCSTSQLISPSNRKWNEELIERLGLPRKIFPEIIPPGTVLGDFRPEIKGELGIHNTKMIAVAEHDTASAVASVPASGKNWAYLSAGTWFCLGAEIKEPIISDKSFSNGFANEGGVENTWRLLKNIPGFWFIEQAKHNFEQKENREISYAEILMEAEAAPADLARIDMDAPEFLAPLNMVTAIQGHCRERGLHVPRNKGEMVRIILESVIARCDAVLNELEDVMGERVERLHLVGGGVKNRLFCKLLPNGIKREVITGPEEATSTGNLSMQLIALGELSSLAQARKLIGDSVTLQRLLP